MRIEELFLNENYPNKSFYIIDDFGQWHYHELRIRVLALAEKLKCQGIQPLDRVALISENSASFLVCFLGILTVGAIAVPIDPQIPVANVLDRVTQCGIHCICISGIRPEKNFAPEGGVFPPEGGVADDCIIISEKCGDWGSDHIDNRAGTVPFVPVGTAKDAAVILFSSGTTGTPKGVVLTHQAIMENVAAITEYMKPDSTDIFYIIKTMVHTATLTGEVLTGLRAGAGLIVRNPVVPPTTILKRVETMKPTILFANPSLLRILLKVKNTSFDLSSLRLVYTSGAVAEKELIMEAEKLFPKAEVFNIYGLTEAGPRVTAQRAVASQRAVAAQRSVTAQRTDGGMNKPGSVGKPIRGVSLIIKNEEGEQCKSGETGRIHVKSPSLMLGYWNDPDSTSGKIVDGWLDTGDLGTMDEDGELFILGRADEVIIRGSHNIDPYRIENVIRKFPGVANCIVFGVPDPIDGHRVVCSIQKEPEVSLEHKKIMAYYQQYLAPYECPQVICEWTDIPMTPSGKLSRQLARDYYLQQKLKP